MSLEIARNTMKANLKKVAAKDVPFLYAQSASDKKPVLLVGELGRNLPGPVVAEVKKGATGLVTGFVNKGSRASSSVCARERSPRGCPPRSSSS